MDKEQEAHVAASVISLIATFAIQRKAQARAARRARRLPAEVGEASREAA